MDTMTTHTTGLELAVARTRPCTRRCGQTSTASVLVGGSTPRGHRTMWHGAPSISTFTNYRGDIRAFSTGNGVNENKRTIARHLGTRST